MQNYKHYFFSLIGGGEGQNAHNWKAALEALPGMGMGINPRPGERQPLDAPHHGITVMIDAGGNARGRIWLPTDEFITDGNGNRWFTHEIQVIADGPSPGSFVWAWESKGGAAPRPFDSTQTPTPPVPPPANDHAERIAVLEAKVAKLEAQMSNVPGAMDAVARAVVKGATVRVGRNYGHGHPATIEP